MTHTPREKILYTFNQFYTDFIKDLKTINSIKPLIQKNYKIIDKMSDEFIEYYWNNIKERINDIISLPNDILIQNESFLEIYLVKDVNVKKILDSLQDKDNFMLCNYLYILTIFANIYQSCPTEDDKSNQWIKLCESVIVTLGKIQKNMRSNNAQPCTNVSDGIEEILDDDIRTLLEKIIENLRSRQTTHNKRDDTRETKIPENMFGDSKIMKLAKEISDNINTDSLNIKEPGDVLKMLDFSDKNNVLGDIIKKVGSSVGEKINNGELNKEDLIGEAMTMMSALNTNNGASGSGGGLGGLGDLAGMMSNPMISEMMKNMKRGNVQTRNTGRSDTTRDRLKKKLDEKKKLISRK